MGHFRSLTTGLAFIFPSTFVFPVVSFLNMTASTYSKAKKAEQFLEAQI